MLCVLPCLILYLQRVMQGPADALDDQQIARIANSLQRQEYDPNVHKHESQCVICLQKYEANDFVT
jgi:hypothetical protein